MGWLERCEIMAEARGQRPLDRWQVDYEFFESSKLVYLFRGDDCIAYGPLSVIERLADALMGRRQ
jgi:hypothetical protein